MPMTAAQTITHIVRDERGTAEFDAQIARQEEAAKAFHAASGETPLQKRLQSSTQSR
ncbi:MAG: hypothetical protein HY298_03505 [Verrucomicrobia bacterium]|nr:hypothetical protein [Verrucomicrobiota bacterium]